MTTTSTESPRPRDSTATASTLGVRSRVDVEDVPFAIGRLGEPPTRASTSRPRIVCNTRRMRLSTFRARTSRQLAMLSALVVVRATMGCDSGEIEAPLPAPVTGPRWPALAIEALPLDDRALLLGSFESSGTRARLGFAGLLQASTEAEPLTGLVDMGPCARFSRADGSVLVDVYHFTTGEAVADGVRAATQLARPDRGVRVGQNGPFVFRVVATGGDADRAADEVAATLAGEE